MIDREYLEWYVLGAVTPAYENISGIESSLKTWSEEHGFSFSGADIRTVLGELIASGLIDSWILAVNSPENRRISYDPDQIGTLWFLISNSGQQRLEFLDKRLRGGALT